MDETAFGDHVRERQTRKLWLWLLICAGILVIVGIVVGLVTTMNVEKEDIFLSDEEVLTDYAVGELTKESANFVIDKLVNVINDSDDQNEVVEAAISLSILYRVEEKLVIQNLKKVSKMDLSPENRYKILSRLLMIYQEVSNECNQRDALIGLLDLPEDLNPEGVDWLTMRAYWQKQLDVLNEKEKDGKTE